MKIGVIGSGVMGKQLAKLLVDNEFQVTVLTRNKVLAFEKFNQKYPNSSSRNFSKLINFTEKVSEISQSSIIFECLPEVKETKRKVYAEISAESDSIIASCTSTFTLGELSLELNKPSQLQIAHFSNPMSKLHLVEVVLAENISVKDKELFIRVLMKLNRRIFYVPDSHGFVLNRLLFPYLKEALNLKINCDLSPIEIDEIMKSGCNFPLGPFATMRLVGVSTVENIFTSLGIVLSNEEKKALNSIEINK